MQTHRTAVSLVSDQGVERLPRLSTAHLALALGGPVAITVAAWIYLAVVARDMSAMSSMAMAMPMHPAPLGAEQLVGLVVMWVVMMVAMMLPTALPMLVTYARLRSAEPNAVRLTADVAAFVAGYVAAWSAFGLVATAFQALLTDYAYLSPMTMKLGSALVAGAILVAAGIYQWLPWKDACLGRCRSPIGFLMTAWRDGPAGAFAMGWRHGLFCVGCCWALMAILFVAGVMNAFWMAVLAGYMLAEKVVPHGAAVARAVGVALVGGGLWMMFP